MKILFITYHWNTNSHHSNYSGYQRLIYYISKLHNVTVLSWGSKNIVYLQGNIKVIIKRTTKSDYFYQKRLLLSWHAHKIEDNYDIIHALHCELGLFIKNKKRLITTVHVHPSIVKYDKLIANIWIKLRYMIIDKQAIKKSKYNIVVSNNLLEIINKEGVYNVEFIPHGIDTLFWKREKVQDIKDIFDDASSFNLNVLVVGLHGMNYILLKNIIKRYPQIRFIIISNQFSLISNNVTILCKISDIQLKKLYNFADILFRPLYFATANNSILEAIAMNTPIITNRISGITDYLSDDNSFLADNNEEFYQIFDKILRNKKILEDKIRKLRAVASSFSWNNIALKIESLYTKVYKNI